MPAVVAKARWRRGRFMPWGSMEQRQTTLLLALCRMGFLRPRERIRVATTLGSAAELESLHLADLEQILGRRLRTTEFQPDRLLGLAESDGRSLTRDGIGCIFFFDPRYPRALRDIYDPPLALFCRGKMPREDGRAVAVVGTRRPSSCARSAAREAGYTLARAGVSVVSGLARGVDGEAHRGAIAAGGSHVAVLGCGLARILPASNAVVGRRILALGGTLLSEHPPDEPPRKQHFPARNRLISGLSQAVVIVQAPERSGALITADFALEQGTEVLVHAAGLRGGLGVGGAALADSGARVVSSGADLLGALGMEPPVAEGDGGRESIGQRIARAFERELEELGEG